MEALREFTYRDLRAGIDGDFIHADQHMRELKRGTRYKGTKGTTVTFETFSSEFDRNNIIWTQSIKLMDLKDALKMTDLKLSDRVKLAMAGDIGVRCDCLTGDVRVPLLDGTSPTMLELLERYGVDEEFWVYSVDGKGDFVPGRAKCLGERKRVRSTVRVTLDNDESFECTKEHPVMRRDGSYVLAADLRVGDSLMPIYREMDGEYENYLINSEQRWERTYQRVASTVNREQLRETWARVKADDEETNVACHHVDENKLNNAPENLRWLGWREHWMHHAKLGTKRLRAAMDEILADPELYAKMVEHNRNAGRRCIELHPELTERARAMAQMWLDENKDVLSQRMKDLWVHQREALVARIKERSSTPEARKRFGDLVRESWTDPEKRAKRIEQLRKARSSAEYRENARKTQKQIWASDEIRLKHSARLREIWAERKAVANHKVKSVVFVEHDVQVPVYDITVEGSHNFLIAPGVVVHNCPAFLYWGYAWILTQLDAIDPPPEDRKPDIRNPGSRGTVCKHLALVFSVFGNHWNSVTRDLKAQGLV